MESGINYVYSWQETPLDDRGHGTHIAGIIGAVGNNGIGGSGICWDVTIIPFKVLNWDGEYVLYEHVLESITAAKNMGIDVLNLSIDCSYAGTGALTTAIQLFDGLVVFAAGNDGFSIGNNGLGFTASLCNNVLIVGNSTQSNTRHSTSNYGDEEVHLFASGTDIYSTGLSSAYISYTGTSMAAPMVVGAAALLMSEYPNATVEQVKNAIIYSVNKYTALENCCISGGVLNVRGAVEYLSDLHGNGDVNMDGTVNNQDIIKLARYLDYLDELNDPDNTELSSGTADSRKLNEDQIMRADMNKDNSITEADQQALGQYLVQRSIRVETE